MNFTEEDIARFCRDGVLVCTRNDGGGASERVVHVVRRFKGFSVSSGDWPSLFGERLDRAVLSMCRLHGCEALAIDERELDEDEPRVDRALRLHAAYTEACKATREATAGLTDAEFREFCVRRGR